MGLLLAQLSESGVAFKSVFSNPNLRRTQLALAGASLGGSAYMLAVSVYAYQQGGVNAVGLVWLIRMIPSALFAPIGGLLADRYPRIRVMIAADGIRLGLMLVAALSVWRGWPAGIVYAISVVNSMCRSPYESANSALLPSLARTPAELTAANAVSGTIDSVGMFVGPALAGAILAGLSISAGFLFTAGMIAWSLAQVFGIRVPKAEVEEVTPEATDADAASTMRRFLGEVLAGFKAIGSDSRLALMLGLFAAASAVAGALEVLMVDVALRELRIGNAGLGYLNTAFGVGALVGAFLTAGLAGKRRLSFPFVAGALLCGAPVLIAAFPDTGAAVVAMALLGIGSPLVDVPCFTILQRAVPQAILGRAFGALSLIWLSSIGIGAIVVPLLLHVMSLRATLIVVGAFVPVLVAVFWRPLFDIDAKAVAPAGDLIELLRRTPIFAPLPGGSLETLVNRLIPVPADAGETIIQEGEAGDRFYVIADGQVEVSAAGRLVNTLGPGDYVGEIALIRDVPRTATVTATKPTRLYALERDDFLTAVTGHGASRTAAEAEITARLAGLEAASGRLSALRT